MAEAIRWLMKLGSRWRAIILGGFAPINWATRAKSSSRSESNFDLTARAKPVQSNIPQNNSYTKVD